MPAVMEANLAAVPLVVLTADRPPEAHGWGANQTAAQAQLYGSQVRACHAVALPDAALLAAGRYLRALASRLVEDSLFPLPGPVHANLPSRPRAAPAAPRPSPPLPRVAVLQPEAVPAAAPM
jgi:2-succinyl-5-enolpyruvyl-6-hydroxy-3-cyclohexene-1-carboxylate synthase